MRIAMWSGPRNLSTAMMYAFARRPDCAVWDEPFYASYLYLTGLDHPMRQEIIEAGETNPNHVISACLGSIPGGKPLFYQKHMTQHMLPGIDRSWLAQVSNVFLIRHPARVVASYAAKRENPTLDDIGFHQQYELFEEALRFGAAPVVVDSADIRADPQGMLTRLCEALGLDFDPAMLYWPAGGNPADGVWARHWYNAVHRSTGFAGAEGNLPELSDTYTALVESALPYYRSLWAERL